MKLPDNIDEMWKATRIMEELERVLNVSGSKAVVERINKLLKDTEEVEAEIARLKEELRKLDE